jgi:phage replication-related protein YjqB (UPF0714/DUF867 family)
MNNLYDVHSWSKQYRVQALHEARLTHLERRLRENHKARSERTTMSLPLAKVLLVVRGAQGGAMEWFTRSTDSGNGEGLRPVPARGNGEDTPPRLPFGGVVVDDGKLSRRQVLRGLAAAGAIAVIPTAFAFGPGTAQAAALAATYQASVKKALQETQQDLINDEEHCSADPEKLATVGCVIGQQVRIVRNSSQYALYTVKMPRQESPDNIVRMGAGGRGRLGTSDELAAILSSQVPDPTLTEAEAEAKSEFVERLRDNGTHKGLVAIAPHGGQVELYTDDQAERVAEVLASQGVSSWRCKGWKQGGGAHERWHITSTDIHPASFPKLGQVISRGFRYAVAFHGFGRTGVLIGGAAPYTLKREIELAIERAVAGSGLWVRIAQPGDDLGGSSSHNIVNRLTAGGVGGIQIEQSLSARGGHWQAIADAVASVYRSKLA